MTLIDEIRARYTQTDDEASGDPVFKRDMQILLAELKRVETQFEGSAAEHCARLACASRQARVDCADCDLPGRLAQSEDALQRVRLPDSAATAIRRALILYGASVIASPEFADVKTAFEWFERAADDRVRRLGEG